MLRRTLIVAVCTASAWVAVAVTAGAASSTAKPTGNPAIIAFYRRAVAATNALPVLQDVEHHQYWLYDAYNADGTSAQFLLAWGDQHKPAPYFVPATATLVERMVHSKNVWLTATFAPACSGSCATSMAPLELYVTPHGDHWGYVGLASKVACWNRATGTTSWIDKDFTADGGWSTDGDFVKRVTHGTRSAVTSTFPDANGAKVTEVDTVNLKDLRFTGAAISVARGGHPIHPGWSYSITESDPTTTPLAPKVKLCS